MMSRNMYDLVLTDLQMPGMSGYALAQRIKQNYPGIPVGAITAHAGKQEKFKCAKFGIADILVKPASLKNLKEFIGKNIGKSGKGVAEAAEVPGSRLPYRDVLISATESSLAALRKHLLQGDLMAVHREIHAMKGSFAVAGLKDRVEDMDRLSSLVNMRHLHAVDEALTDLLENLRDI